MLLGGQDRDIKTILKDDLIQIRDVFCPPARLAERAHCEARTNQRFRRQLAVARHVAGIHVGNKESLPGYLFNFQASSFKVFCCRVLRRGDYRRNPVVFGGLPERLAKVVNRTLS